MNRVYIASLGGSSDFFRALTGRDRSAAHTTVGGECSARALSIGEVSVSFPHGPRFHRPPCDSGRWDVPRPVLTLATRRSPSYTTRSSRADAHTPLHARVCFHGCCIVHRPYMVRLLLKRPRAPSLFACSRDSLAQHGVWHHVSGHYPTCIACMSSCANPQSSRCLGATRGQWV